MKLLAASWRGISMEYWFLYGASRCG